MASIEIDNVFDEDGREYEAVDFRCIRYEEYFIDGRGLAAKCNPRNVDGQPKVIVKPVRWKPKDDEQYFTIDLQGSDLQGREVRNCIWYGSTTDKWNYDTNTVFKTYEEAEQMLKRIRELLREGI